MVNPAFDDGDELEVLGDSTHEATSAGTSIDATSVSTPATSSGTSDPSKTTTSGSSEGGTTHSSSSSSSTTGEACNVALPPPTGCDPACDACDEGTCIVLCAGDPPCEGQTLMCPGPGPCLFSCQGADACNGATLVCQGEHPCGVECAGARACEQAEVQCAGGTCSVACASMGGGRVCSGMLVQCGDADALLTCEVGQMVSPELVPSSGCACESTGC